jgi:hypothetical protein
MRKMSILGIGVFFIDFKFYKKISEFFSHVFKRLHGVDSLLYTTIYG